MTTFNPENKDILNYRESLNPAMEITDPEDAKQYKEALIKYTERFLTNGLSESGMTAEEVVNSNLGYYAGYYSLETRERVEKLFNCSHPVFGSIKDNGAPTPKQAFEAGLEIGKQMKKKK